MKLTELLIVTWCSITVARSKTVESNQETLLKKAAEQLERLEPYRRATDNHDESNFSNVPETWKPLVDQNQLDEIKDDVDQNVSWEMSEILPEQTEPDSLKRIDDKKLITISVITDPRYAELMQNRIKRGYDVGSTSLLTSIAGGVLTGIASASSGSAAKASAGSSETAYKPVYGAPTVEHAYSYEEKPFGPWDFKKVIFSTLFQALKAIGGGVLALKGQLVKGGGYLLAGKGKVVSKAGDVITSFGKHLAANAQSKPYPPETFYDHPPVQHIEHNPSYPGSPPNSDDFSEVSNDFSAHETYGVPSNDNGQGGLLIVTPTKSDLDKNNNQQTHVAVLENPDPTKNSVIKNLLNSVLKDSVGSKDQTVAGQDSLTNNNVNSYPLTQHPIPTYNVPERYPTNYNNPAAQDGAYQRPELPQITSHHHFSNLGLDPNLLIQPNVEYPLQQIQYPHGSLLDPSKRPHDDSDTSVYASLSVDTEPQIAPLKISLLGHSDSLDLPKLQPHVDFYGKPQFMNHLHGSLSGPLRVPLLSPMPSAYYWRSQGSLIPTSPFDTLDNFRKRNVQRRAFAKRLARYASLQRFHRL
ncbi:PREDICTED: uncharacterized protein LOC108755599 [Trachymyrmex septentrionalis]|uniref:uncharacterized protein LOC108755599 n=1 Tax=Trachymyrmex septentrionalis TaxID=34720 RepID=UPI00084EFFF8|nr:PREDICTED: uncharacterized protein LOC108755599 [Trachymyrmex septentrionalis]XP_018354217.1 PREDICTED: uncharacterized protein LOC108755599 [Trachymyrmex septentrionalis]